jgi:hypothetical protein
MTPDKPLQRSRLDKVLGCGEVQRAQASIARPRAGRSAAGL